MTGRIVRLSVVLCLLLTTLAEAATVTGGIRRDPRLPAGADDEGRVLLYTPNPLEPGSSHSHFDNSADPNLLMEPSIHSDLAFLDVDLTRQVMEDLGWADGSFNFTVTYSDPRPRGFRDPELGERRRLAFESAAAAWSLLLGSRVTIEIEARFQELSCDDGTATLATAGPRFAFADFAAVPAGIWFPGPLAESLAGSDLSSREDADEADLRVTVNSSIDKECLAPGSRFYYGLDGDVPAGQISFVTVMMHELAHGLGFVGLLDTSTGELLQGLPDIFTVLTFDTKQRKHWDEMSDAERRRSVRRERQVSFDGPATTRQAERRLKGRVFVEIGFPAKLDGSYEVGTATFGPSVTKKGVRGELALVDDGSDRPTLACRPIVNGEEIAGKIAVIDRGECLFVTKVKHAQDVGALAVIIVHNESGPPPGLGGSDDSIVIPAVRIGRRDGRRIKRELRK